MKLRALHGFGLAVAILVVASLLTGVVYAGVRFAPDLIRLLDKHVNEQGRTEYSVPDFANCHDTANPAKTNTFAVKPTIHINDDEVKKIIQAKCELQGIDAFASKMWPTYGQHKQWQSGDTIYYTRPDILGTVRSIDEHHVTLEYSGSQSMAKTYQTFEGKKLLAFFRDQKVNPESIKPGDYVFAIERVAEVYEPGPSNSDPHGVGIVAVVKMALPQAYYGGKQSDIYEVRPCYNNGDETCPAEYPSGIDVFPRGSEGATNPDLRQRTATVVDRDINGIVTTINVDTFTVKSNKVRTFTVRLPKQILDDYNTAITEIYKDIPKMETVKTNIYVGSWVSITYLQDRSDNPRLIQKSDIFKIYILLDLQVK